jgi:hypothetical protein
MAAALSMQGNPGMDPCELLESLAVADPQCASGLLRNMQCALPRLDMSERVLPGIEEPGDI